MVNEDIAAGRGDARAPLAGIAPVSRPSQPDVTLSPRQGWKQARRQENRDS